MRNEALNYLKCVLIENNTGKQEFSSAKTSRPQKPSLHTFLVKHNMIPEGSLVLDYGGGKYDIGKEFIENSTPNTRVLVYDKYNRSEEHNDKVLNIVKSKGGADIILNANVLNVIKEKDIRLDVIKQFKEYSKKGTKIYISVYNAVRIDKYEETDNYVGQPTSDGWQNAQKIDFYLPEVQTIFPNAIKKHNMIVIEL